MLCNHDVMTTLASRLAALVGITLTSLALSGCFLSPASQAEHGLRNALADSVAESQDIVWEFREELTRDPEAALPAVWGVADARPVYSDATHEVAFGSWTLLGLQQSDDGTALTLTTSARYESGGGFFAHTSDGFTCYTLLIAPDASRIDTEPSDCTDGNGHGLSDFVDISETRVVPVQELDVQRTVDASDHEPLPCQCSSGGDCDCPGG